MQERHHNIVWLEDLNKSCLALTQGKTTCKAKSYKANVSHLAMSTGLTASACINIHIYNTCMHTIQQRCDRNANTVGEQAMAGVRYRDIYAIGGGAVM